MNRYSNIKCHVDLKVYLKVSKKLLIIPPKRKSDREAWQSESLRNPIVLTATQQPTEKPTTKKNGDQEIPTNQRRRTATKKRKKKSPELRDWLKRRVINTRANDQSGARCRPCDKDRFFSPRIGFVSPRFRLRLRDTNTIDIWGSEGARLQVCMTD